MTTIALHSDMHLELQKLPECWLDSLPDVLILAGDISYISDIASLSRHMSVFISFNAILLSCLIFDLLAALVGRECWA